MTIKIPHENIVISGSDAVNYLNWIKEENCRYINSTECENKHLNSISKFFLKIKFSLTKKNKCYLDEPSDKVELSCYKCAKFLIDFQNKKEKKVCDKLDNVNEYKEQLIVYRSVNDKIDCSTVHKMNGAEGEVERLKVLLEWNYGLKSNERFSLLDIHMYYNVRQMFDEKWSCFKGKNKFICEKIYRAFKVCNVDVGILNGLNTMEAINLMKKMQILEPEVLQDIVNDSVELTGSPYWK